MYHCNCTAVCSCPRRVACLRIYHCQVSFGLIWSYITSKNVVIWDVQNQWYIGEPTEIYSLRIHLSFKAQCLAVFCSEVGWVFTQITRAISHCPSETFPRTLAGLSLVYGYTMVRYTLDNHTESSRLNCSPILSPLTEQGANKNDEHQLITSLFCTT